MRNHLRTISVVFIVLTVYWNTQSWATGYSDSLIAVPGGEDVRFDRIHGTEHLYYRLSAQYPAKEFIETISARLQGLGWIPMEDSFLNPGIPSCHVRGWGRFEDATEKRVLVVNQWWGDWGNDTGEVVTYILRYTYPKDQPPDLRSLDVTAIYTPKERADTYKYLQPLLAKQKEHIQKKETEKIKKRVDRIRQESKHSGEITIRLVKLHGSSIPSSKGAIQKEVQFDPSLDPVALKVAAANVKRNFGGNASIEIVFTADAAALMKEFSTDHINEYIAVLVDGEVVSVARLSDEMEDIAVIAAPFTPKAAKQIVDRIMTK